MQNKGPYYEYNGIYRERPEEDWLTGQQGAYVVEEIPKVKNVKNQNKKIVTILLIIINTVVYFLCLKADDYRHVGGLNYQFIMQNKEYGRLLSYMFLHADLSHLTNNMFALYVAGTVVEEELGSLRTSIIYFVSGIGAAFITLFGNHMIRPDEMRFSVGASGAIFGMIVAACFLMFKRRSQDVKKTALYSVIFVVIYAIITYSQNIDLLAHIGGAVVGGIVALLLSINKWEDYKETIFARILGISVTVIVSLIGVGEARIGQSLGSLPDPRIDLVKEQSIDSQPDVTYDEAFSNYSMEGKWTAFTATDGEEVVQYEAKTFYRGAYHALRVQFLVAPDNLSSEMCYFSFDEEAQYQDEVDRFFSEACEAVRRSR
ncbi:MAG: rhomboid family intramembrane serine protease [Wujia sp.]